MPRDLARLGLPSGLVARVVITDSRDGDLGPRGSTATLEARRAKVAPVPWTWLQQIHGSTVVKVDSPGDHQGEIADAAVTSRVGCTLSVTVADCVPVAVLAEGGGIAVVHAGWRGILGGIIEAAVDSLSELADGPYRAVIGPCINACCYAFGVNDLQMVVAQLGDEVRSETRMGLPALELSVAAELALGRVGVIDLDLDGRCTSCDDRHWSHRATGTRQRHALAAWLESV